MGATGLTSEATAAAIRYVAAAGLITVCAVALFADAFSSSGTLSTTKKLLIPILLLASIVTHRHLGYRHRYYRETFRRREGGEGCLPPRVFPRDPFGIRYLLDSARHVARHDLLQYRTRCFAALGPTYRHAMFPEPYDMVTTSEPEVLKAMLATRFDDWALPQSRVDGFMPVLGRHSIFAVNGPEWRHSRALLRPAFVRDQVSDMRCFDRHVGRMMARIPPADVAADDGGSGVVGGARCDLQELFGCLTIDTITDFMFGHSTDLLSDSPPAESVEFVRHFDLAIQKVAYRGRLGWLTQVLPDRELDESTGVVKRYVMKYIEQMKAANEKKENQDSDDNSDNKKKKNHVFLHDLIASYDGHPEALRDQIISMFIAGRDTTTSVLTYLFLELSRNPHIQDKIRREVRDAAATLDNTENSGLPTWEQLRNLKYLNASIKEALRLNPPVASNSREAVRDTVLPLGGGPDGKSPLFVTKGTNVRWQSWCMHRRTDVFGPDAGEFRPERWSEDERLRKGVGYEYLPFNGGPRICIGQQFALTQMALVTFRVLQEFREIVRDDAREPVQKLSINTSMLHGCWVRARRG